MKPVVVAKILQEALHTSWNFSFTHWLHHPMKVKKSNFNSSITRCWFNIILSYVFLVVLLHYHKFTCSPICTDEIAAYAMTCLQDNTILLDNRQLFSIPYFSVTVLEDIIPGFPSCHSDTIKLMTISIFSRRDDSPNGFDNQFLKTEVCVR